MNELLSLCSIGNPTFDDIFYICFKLVCAGHYYDEWVTDSDPIQTYNYILAGCFLLHVLMSIPIKIAKIKWNHYEKKLFDIGKFKKAINFGEMQTIW